MDMIYNTRAQIWDINIGCDSRAGIYREKFTSMDTRNKSRTWEQDTIHAHVNRIHITRMKIGYDSRIKDVKKDQFTRMDIGYFVLID